MLIHVHVGNLLTAVLVVHHNLHLVNVAFEPSKECCHYVIMIMIIIMSSCHHHSHGVSLHLSPGLPSPLLPVQGVQVAVHVGRGRREDPLGISLDSLVNNVTRAMDFFRCDL